MKARRILHEQTQRFLRGRWRTEEGVYVNKEQTWTSCEPLLGYYKHAVITLVFKVLGMDCFGTYFTVRIEVN